MKTVHYKAGRFISTKMSELFLFLHYNKTNFDNQLVE